MNNEVKVMKSFILLVNGDECKIKKHIKLFLALNYKKKIE